MMRFLSPILFTKTLRRKFVKGLKFPDKRILFGVLVIAVMALTLVGCGNDDEEAAGVGAID